LIKNHANTHVEPIVLLKMICPNNRYTRVLRVLLDMQSVRESIIWVNCDMEPQNFAVES